MSWLDSIYSDGTKDFISNPQPKLNETVNIKIRFFKSAPVKQVFLRPLINGAEEIIECHKEKEENGLVYYSADLKITEESIRYRFYLTTEDTIYFYNQKGITTYIPDKIYDFVILADYDQPSWVKESVFYQIFPERFYNGNTDNDVVSGEYISEGFETIKYKTWNEVPLDYEQGHCLDFYGGDLEGIQAKIPYFKELGVTALYLNPIFSAPSVHKYDCIDYFHVDEHFGGDKALENLAKALHENGIRLILDISINHTGTDHIWFNKDGIFYDKSVGAYNNKNSLERNFYFFNEDNNYKGWWDLPTMPTLNFTSKELRDVIYKDEDSVLKKWLKPPYNIDGWRFDVADVFARNNEIQLAREVWPEIRKSIKEENPEAYILAEHWDDAPESLQGTEWDSTMNYFGCARVIRQFIGEPDLFLGRYEDLRKIHYKMTAEDVVSRITQHLAKLPYVIAQNQFNLLDSHDVSRIHNNPEVDKDELRGATILQFTLIGAPSIYYGDEAEIDGVLGTNEGCRYPMPWDKDFKETETFKLFQRLAHLKTSLPALSEGGMKFLYAKNNIIVLSRFYQGNTVIAIMSINKEEQIIEIPIHVLGVNELVSPDLLGKEFKWEKSKNGVKITIPPKGSFLIEAKYN